MCTEKLLTITLEMSANEVNTTSYDFLLTQAVFGLNLVQRKTQYPHQNMLITNWPNQTGQSQRMMLLWVWHP